MRDLRSQYFIQSQHLSSRFIAVVVMVVSGPHFSPRCYAQDNSCEPVKSSRSNVNTSASVCTHVQQCLHNHVCGQCLHGITQIEIPDADPEPYKQAQQTRMWTAMQEYCNNNSVLTSVSAAVNEIYNSSNLCQDYGFSHYFAKRGIIMFNCFKENGCRECFSLQLQADNKTRALTSNACESVSQDQKRELAYHFYNFPSCSYAKLICDSTCRRQLIDLQHGDYQEPSISFLGSNTTELVLKWCTRDAEVARIYWYAKCDGNTTCSKCLKALNYGSSRSAIAQGALSDACRNAQKDHSVMSALSNYILNAGISSCARAMYFCTMGMYESSSYAPQFCASCFLNPSGTNCTETGKCLLAKIESPGQVCAACSPSIYTYNAIVMATSIVGGLSVFSCLYIVFIIFAYNKDQHTLRERLVLGLMIGNIIYSSANVIPINEVDTTSGNCGAATLDSSISTFGRAWWFMGKYIIVFYEFFILLSSFVALKYGVSEMNRVREGILHTICFAAGFIAFVVFFVAASRINDAGFNSESFQDSKQISFSYVNMDDDMNDNSPDLRYADLYANGAQDYSRLTESMMQAWLAALGCAIVGWILLRLQHHRMIIEWQKYLQESMNQWDRDLWHSSAQQERTIKSRLVVLIREAYDEIARPLEPYVFVFVLFSIPAIIMSTEYCISHARYHFGASSQATVSTSEQLDETSLGMCYVACELTLAFRSFSTVIVYLFGLENRLKVIYPPTLFQKLRRRVENILCCQQHGKVKIGDVDIKLITPVKFLPEYNSDDSCEEEAMNNKKEIATDVSYARWEDNPGND